MEYWSVGVMLKTIVASYALRVTRSALHLATRNPILATASWSHTLLDLMSTTPTLWYSITPRATIVNNTQWALALCKNCDLLFVGSRLQGADDIAQSLNVVLF